MPELLWYWKNRGDAMIQSDFYELIDCKILKRACTCCHSKQSIMFAKIKNTGHEIVVCLKCDVETKGVYISNE